MGNFPDSLCVSSVVADGSRFCYHVEGLIVVRCTARRETDGMIYFFSGTGNSRWVAGRVAEALREPVCSIMDAHGDVDVSGRVFGIVFPVYAWDVPLPVKMFMKKIHGLPEYSFGVCTCGLEAGRTMEKLDALFHMDASYSVIMPDNYIFMFKPEDRDSIVDKLNCAKETVNVIISDVAARRCVNRVHKGRFAYFKSGLVSWLFNRAAVGTRKFWVTDACTSCGKCALNCPAKVINMKNGVPVWVSPRCFHCSACINGCPAGAVQYGRGTLRYGRYMFDETILSASGDGR